MGVLRAVTVGIVALVGVVLGVVGFLLLGLFAVAPPAISQAAPRQDWDVAIELTDAFLSTQLNRDNGGDQPVKLSNAKAVAHADGTLTITGNVGGAGGASGTPTTGGNRLPINPASISVPVEIVMRPTASQDGKLRVEIVKAQFGPLPVPNQIGKVLENPVNSQIATAMNSQPFFITNVTLRDGALTVRARQTTP